MLIGFGVLVFSLYFSGHVQSSKRLRFRFQVHIISSYCIVSYGIIFIVYDIGRSVVSIPETLCVSLYRSCQKK